MNCYSLKAVTSSFIFLVVSATSGYAQESHPPTTTTEIPFKTHDGFDLFGKLTRPSSDGPHAVVIYVQTAEAMTVNMRRPKGGGQTFDYFDLYASKLPEMNVAFFRYQGRGVQMGDKPPRFETIDWEIFNTSTLDNKVKDILSAIDTVKQLDVVDHSRIFLMGASEGTLLAAEAAAQRPTDVAGLILYGVMSGNLRENMKYIFSDGGFLTYLQYFDSDGDETISQEEFEADRRKYRERVFNNAEFETFDRDKNGVYTVDDLKLQTQPLLDAIDNENYGLLNLWAKTSAGATTPQDWFKDHFAHPTIWSFLEKLDMPIGIFHGALDGSCPIEGVKKMEQRAKQSGKPNIEFHYFPDLDHSLDIAAYFIKDTLPDGHRRIFEFIERQTAR